MIVIGTEQGTLKLFETAKLVQGIANLSKDFGVPHMGIVTKIIQGLPTV